MGTFRDIGRNHHDSKSLKSVRSDETFGSRD